MKALLKNEWGGRPYIISPLFDLGMAGGFALLAFALLALAFHPGSAHFPSQQLYCIAILQWLALLANDPHFIVSYQLLYKGHAAKLRRFRHHTELRLRYIAAGIVVPVCMAGYFACALYTQSARMFSYAIDAMLITVGWHYVKQAYGVFIVLSAMKKIRYSRLQRQGLLLNSYIVWAFYCITALSGPSSAAILLPSGDFNYALPHLFTLPPIVKQAADGLFLISGFASLFIIVWDRHPPHYYSRTAFTGYMSMYYLLIFSSLHPLWLIAYPFFHSLQYLLFVYAYKRGELGTGLAKAQQAAERRALVMQARWFTVAALAGGALWFAMLPQALETWIDPGKTFLFPAALICIVFINVHHYFIDNVIWRKEHAEIADYVFYRPCATARGQA